MASAIILLNLLSCSKSDTWFKGNLHTHSLWSDGDDFPEMIVDWYKTHGYDFVAISDHNVLAEDERWIVIHDSTKEKSLQTYLGRWSTEWVAMASDSGAKKVRLKTLAEYRGLFEDPGKFLLVQSEEISDRLGKIPIHINATNIAERIAPQGGSTVLAVLQNNIDAVLQQSRETGVAILPHVNHPNYKWAVTAQDLIALRGDHLFELYNGHPLVHNLGDSAHMSIENMWDVVLANRIAQGRPPLFGIAVDDAHNYHETGKKYSNPGMGWIMVRAEELTAPALLAALELGDFYATTGVSLTEISCNHDRIKLKILTEPGVQYVTEFIGTSRNFTQRMGMKRVADEDIGRVLDYVPGSTPTYVFKGDELYVRAKVISTKLKTTPYETGDYEVAWSQPVLPGRRSREQ